MRFSTLLLFLLLICRISLSQVVAEGDTVLCSGQEGELPITLTATSFAVDLTDANIYSDDTFGGVIDLGFDFDFYGNTYNQVVLSSNNYLSFNTANAGGYSGWNIGAAVPNNFDAPMNAILCPWQDIYPGVNGNGIIAYATTGQAPNRVFIASFCGIPMFSCTDICYSSQIKLFESSNIIETHIAQKVLCSTWNDGAAIHALHNNDGTIAHVVTGLDGIERNFPNEWTCENDGWRFTPNGSTDYVLENIDFSPAVAGTDIIWQDEFGNQIGTGSEITIFPSGNTTYTAGASLCGDAGDWCGFEGGIEGDDVVIVYESVDISSIDITNATCDNASGGEINVVVDGTPPFTYEWFSIDQDTILNQSTSNLVGVESGNYQLIITTQSGCQYIEDLIFVDSDGDAVSSAFAGEDIEICETATNLIANSPLPGESGLWTLISGQGLISSNTSSETFVSGLGFGENIFTWTLENECGTSVDEVIITVINGNPAISSLESLSCLEQIPLIVDVENGEGEWTVSPMEGVVINDPFSDNTFATVSDYGTYVFSFEGCNGVDSEIVNMTSSPPELSGPQEVFCLDSFQLEAFVSGDPGFWSADGPGNIIFSNSSSLNPTVSVDNYGIYEFFYYGCGSTSSIIVEMVSPALFIEDPGVIYCNFQIELNANSPFEGVWSSVNVLPGSTLDIQSDGNSAIVTVSDYGTYSISFLSCGIADTLDLTFSPAQPSIVTSDHQNCLLTIDLYAVTPALNSGPWEQVSGPSFAEILDPYSSSTQALVSEFGMYEFSFTSCDTISYVQIGISCPMIVPNSFSPNSDGLNDLFEIADLNPNVYTQSVFYVYNRWGGIVYLNHEYGLNGEWWDGRMIFHNRPFSKFLPERNWDDNTDYVSDGVYFYTLEVYNNTNKQKEFYSGSILISAQKK
tara:strand:+ start:23648 stop:26380 length:2733 start_codon:yes stop_codon:yes gene_type:complete